MERRTVLGRLALVGTTGLAGCVSEDDGSGDGDGGGEATRAATETPTATPTDTPMSPTLTDATIDVSSSDCGNQVSDATVDFDGDDVVVTGTIWGPDPSWTATLADASYDAGADSLAVTIGIEEDEDSGPTIQCIAEIEYTATLTFADGLPGEVTVTHETNEGSVTVVTTRRD